MVIIIGSSVLYWGTDGGQAWTAEKARRLAVRQQPIAVEDYPLLDHNAQATSLFAHAQKGNALILMELIYTSCPTICIAMGAEFSQLQEKLFKTEMQQQVHLLSISFDPTDTPQHLKSYLDRFTINNDNWSAAKFNNESELQTMMKQLGAIAIPEPNFGYIHNSVVYLIQNSQVIAMFEHSEKQAIWDEITQRLDPDISSASL